MAEPLYVYDELNDEQKQIFDRLQESENVFITGDAGTGKSFLVRTFDKWCKQVGKILLKTAPTGAAAKEIDGATLHSQFKLPIEIDFKEPKRADNNLVECDVLLIDEISMVRIDIFDKLAKMIVLANDKRKKQRKKPVQIILVGDFHQLPPVVTGEDRKVLEAHYCTKIESAYCFQSTYWRLFNINFVKLSEIVRQDDEEFCRNLDMLKEGNSSCIPWLNEHSSKTVMREAGNDAIWLCAKNDAARERNENELAKIPGREYISFIKYTGDASDKDSWSVERTFRFKIGAKVMILVNDTQYHEYVNGSLGIIEKYDAREEIIYVRLIDSDVLVEIEKVELEKIKYEITTTKEKEKDADGFPVLDIEGHFVEKEVKKISKKKMGTATQYPLKLGYAVTIHKAQGQTFSKMNLDLNGCFQNGQLYVAISRGKRIEDIYFMQPVTQTNHKTSAEVKEYYANPENYTFFNKEDAEITKTIPKKYEKIIDKLLANPEYFEKVSELLKEPIVKSVEEVKQEVKKADKSSWTKFAANLDKTGAEKREAWKSWKNTRDNEVKTVTPAKEKPVAIKGEFGELEAFIKESEENKKILIKPLT